VKCKYIAEFAAVIAAQPSSLALDLQIQMTAFVGLTREFSSKALELGLSHFDQHC
jgi:hypothetical protein